MPKRKLTTKQAVARWHTSSVAAPCEVIRKICNRFPKKTNKELVAKCVEAGVAKRTASVRVCLFKKKQIKK